MQRDINELIDVVVFIIFLGIAVTLGVAGLFQTDRELRKYSLEVTDKNIMEKDSEVSQYGDDYSPALTKEEIILMSQIQDRGMPFNEIKVVKRDPSGGDNEFVDEKTVEFDVSRMDTETAKSYATSFKTSSVLKYGEGYLYELKYDYKQNCYTIKEMQD